MAAFAFALSLDGSSVAMSQSKREGVLSTLRERSPGPVEEHSSPGVWAALSGPFGELVVSGPRLLLCDGEPGPSNTDFPPVPDGSGSHAACSYDAESGKVRLIRDRFGTRPLFYALHRGRCLVASECKSLQAMGLPLELDSQSLRESLMYRWVTGESCLLSPAVQVSEGTEVILRAGAPPESRRIWQLEFTPEPLDDTAFGRYQDAVDGALRSSMRKVNTLGAPVGVLLSGGVDSSLLTALAKEEFGDCVAFTFRVPGFENPELARARFVAAHLGVELREVEINPAQFFRDLPYIMRRMEGLPRHANNLVLLQVLRQAGQEVKVLLQGDAADTLFGGSPHRRTESFSRKKTLVRWLPPWVLSWATRRLEGLPLERAWRAARVLAWDEHRFLQARDAIHYKHRTRRAMGLSHLDAAAWETGDWSPEQPLGELRRTHLVSTGIQGSLIRHDRLSRPEGVDSLAPYISAEAVSVVTRMPPELCWQGRSKPVLRSLLDRYLPPEASRWPKGRFEVPWADWLFGSLRPLLEEAESRLKETSYLPPGFLRAALDTRDAEGAWSGLSLYLMLREFDLLGDAA